MLKIGGEKRYLFVAIDRATRMVYIRIYERKGIWEAEDSARRVSLKQRVLGERGPWEVLVEKWEEYPGSFWIDPREYFKNILKICQITFWS